MLFKINTNVYTKTNLYILYRARKRVLAFRYGATEIELDRYCLKKFKCGLKATCLNLLNYCKVTRNFTGDLCIMLSDPDKDKLARLITFGTGRIGGSPILLKAFK